MLAHFAALNSLEMWQAQRWVRWVYQIRIRLFVIVMGSSRWQRAALCCAQNRRLLKDKLDALVNDGLCAPPRRGVFSIFV